MRCIRSTLLLLTLLPSPPAAGDDDSAARIVQTRWIGAGVIVAWGLAQWDYGEKDLHFRSEGWFGADTKEGGADKAGHLYTAYLMTRAFDGLYRHWGSSDAEAAREAAVSSLLLTSLIELGDGFSPYGISGEDMAMNVAGTAAGYWLARDAVWRERLDLRVEYRFNRAAGDISTDYENGRYLLALKPAGFTALADTPLQWLEVHAGYYARGYSEPDKTPRRVSYLGFGINLSRLLRRHDWPRTATMLQYYQPPGTTLRAEHEH